VGSAGFEQGLQRAGIETVLQVENDPWCLSVLARHWPEVQRIDDVRNVDVALLQQLGDDQRRRGAGSVQNGHGAVPGLDGRLRGTSGRDALDVRKVDAAALQGRCRDVVSVGAGSDAEWLRATRRGRIDADGVDLVYGGFPCQDVSVAGKRRGLSGDRSGLWHEFHRVLRELRPRWTVIENVPGLLSSGAEPGADFGVVLRGLVDLGYGVAWRVLDARWWGVPQRRRRVFVVGCLGDAARAAAVLAVCESCGGHPQTRREERQDVAFTLAGGSPDTSRRIGNAWNMTFIPEEVAYTLPASVRGTGDGHGNACSSNYVAGSQIDEGAARPLVARASGYRMDMESETFVVAHPLDGGERGFAPRGDGADNLIAAPAIAGSMGVRRLTPREAERLMGWADDWTRYTADGKEIPDSHRYRCIGNGVVAPVAEWIGHRLVEADAWP
jgi:DNA (cytosine-5)-methyltransferase 1